MRPNTAYYLLKYLPEKLRQYGASALDKAYEEMENYLSGSEIELTQENKDRVLIAIFLKFIDDLFVDSIKSYRSSFEFLNQHKIRGMRFGGTTYSYEGPLVNRWKNFIASFEELKYKLADSNIPAGSTISELIESVRREL